MGATLHRWAWSMAWRDSRGSRRRLLLYIASIVAGVAAIVAIRSFQDNLQQTIDQRTKALLGADLELRSRVPLSREATEFIGAIDGRHCRQVEFSSMASFPGTDSSRLVTVRALETGFPYYGELETIPQSAADSWRNGANALVEDNLLRQFDARVGDRIRLGQKSFRIAGRLQKVAGELPTMALVSPRVYIPLRYLEQTELIRPGSRATHSVFIALEPGADVEALVSNLRPGMRRLRLSYDTAERRKERLGDMLGDFGAFLLLVGVGALVLGAIGVASCVHLYVSTKIRTLALLRCLGASSRQAIAIFAVQLFCMGLVGATGGAVLGIGIQALLPEILGDLLPVQIPFSLSLPSIAEGFVAGTAIAMIFGVGPLISLRCVSPLSALRTLAQPVEARRDPLRWALGSVIVAACFALILFQSPSWRSGMSLFAGFAAVFGLLFAAARLAMLSARRWVPMSWSYELRQGLSNLYRPGNQTAVLLLAIGLGVVLTLTLFLLQSSLIASVRSVSEANQSNVVVWDIQADQVDGIERLFDSLEVEIQRRLPVVAMRLAEVNGRNVAELLAEGETNWALRWDYSSTYRDHLTISERLIAGEFPAARTGADVPVSLDQQVAEDLGLLVGDSLVFDVQGTLLPATVGSLREVDWQQQPPNFLIIFPTQALEDFPQFQVLVAQASSSQVSAELQRRLVQRFPTVSLVDLELVLRTVDAVVDDVSFGIRFMAFFTIATGLVVLGAAVASSRLQRIREAALLRVLGASRGQLRMILVAEYLFLGGLASLVGTSLSIATAWLLARYLFEIALRPSLGPLLLAALTVTGVTVAVGALSSRAICRRSALEALRIGTA